MKNTIRLEELAMFGLSVYLFLLGEWSWWWFPALILTPDIGMLGYVAGRRPGAITYNFFHHRGVAIVLLCTGWYAGISGMELAGIILFGHAAMDRTFGYGLKYPDSFAHTHLGWTGKEEGGK